MLKIEGTQTEFTSLSLKDLLEARDLYHFHLTDKANVIGTAIGRYLQRKDGVSKETPRTFENSEVKADSWPCVMVLVDKWIEEHRFGADRRQIHPYQMIPNALFLPDGRRVPVCVVWVNPKPPAQSTIPHWVWPDSYLGPGYPILIDRQGEEHVATVGCLVTDGHTLFALTSQHVCGTQGEPVYTLIRSRKEEIGRTSSKQVTRLLFNECYPDFPSRRTYINLDVGLCEVKDARRWTSQVYGLPGPVGAVEELNEANIGLRLVNAAVVAFGAASGNVEGRIAALFYRYKSTAGFDYVSDFLIAPSKGSGTLHGDSGTVWHLVPKDGSPLRPFAVEWGGHAFATLANGQFRFALATSLSSVCRQLNVDVVRRGDPGVQPFWGQTGHYDIATFAVEAIVDKDLKKLMRANLDRISFAAGSLNADDLADALKHAKEKGYVPLADVPDIVWKKLPWMVKGGRDTNPAPHGSTGPEHPTHFADIDEPSKGPGKKTLRQMCVDDPAKITVKAWQDYFDQLGHKTSTSRGLLPFRIWQHFKTMVDALNHGDVTRFVAAAGTLSHYVGDACQPLHGSMYADGYEDGKGKGVHSCYESGMIDRFSDQIAQQVPAVLGHLSGVLGAIKKGQDAAKETIHLMDRAAGLLPPKKLIETYVNAGGKPNVPEMEALWARWKDQTVATMADGARVLAWIWDSAWKEGTKTKKVPNAELVGRDFDELRTLYEEDKTFVPSLDLNHIGPAL